MENKKIFFSPQPLNIAVLFLIFNRFDSMKQVFGAIRQAKPSRLYIAADGPRKSICKEDEKVKILRDYVMSNIDWKCRVETLFRDENLGCQDAVISAISWFFKKEEMGIILEDDCLPDQSFFWFCEIMLEKYRNETNVMMISGTNYLFNEVTLKESYFFSRYYAGWGWASWKRAWDRFDINMSCWPEYRNSGELTRILKEKEIVEYYTNMFQTVYNRKTDIWDIQWAYSCIFNNGLSIVPIKNLVSNIGITGTHASCEPSVFINMPIESLDINNIKHPLLVAQNILCDKIVLFNILTNRNRLKYYMAKFFKRIKLYNQMSRFYRKLRNI